MDEEGEAINEDHPKASSICAIDRRSVHRICSGQVVLTLATAVKELLENSIDAGATIVDIKLKEYGSEVIEVSDNGMGVHPSNFEGLTLKHHTSKLRDFGDLINVDTFGFRGEALSSLCALCDMSVTTRHTDEAVGTKLDFDHNGKITKQEAQAKQYGTKVVLQNLFYTLPVRHKEFQRNLKKDFAKMVQVLNSYCIISTGIRITCTNITSKGSRSTVVASQGNSLLQENISNIFGPKQVQSLLEFKQKVPGEDVCTEYGLKGNAPSLFKIEGFVSKCEHGLGRSSTDRQFLFINGRPFDSPKLVKVINEAYHQYNRHQYPFVVMKIDVNKDGVDVNVTPDKRQVFMEGEKILLATVKASLSAMFTSTISLLQMHQPSMVTKLVKSRSEPSEDRLRLTSETPINKANTMVSTLSKLKRSFSSAFAKPDTVCSNIQQSPSISSPLSKQRRMDIFVRKGHSPDSSNSGPQGRPIQLYKDLIQSSPDKELETDTVDCVPSGDCVDVNVDIKNDRLDIITIDASGDHHCTLMNKSDVVSGEIQNGKHLNNSIGTLDQNVGKLNVHSYGRNGSFDTELAVTDSAVIDQTATNYDLDDYSFVKMSERTRIESQNSQEMIFASKDYKADLLSCDVSLDNNNSMVETRASMECMEARDSSITLIPHGAREDEDQNEDVDEEERLVKAESQISFSFEQFRKKWKNRCTENTHDTFSRAFRAKINPADNQAAEQELQKEIKKESFSQMDVLGQFNKGFIITKLGNDLFIVDQHATDEKYNFETLQRDTVIQSQKLIAVVITSSSSRYKNPLNLELTASNETILVDNIDIFKKNGFEFMIDEAGLPTQRVKLSSTPVSKNWNFGKEDIEEMIFMLTDSPGVMCRPSRVRAMFASRACRKSIMIGTVLNTSEMKKLLCHMGEIEQPWNCPHGRPTMRHLINLDMIPR